MPFLKAGFGAGPKGGPAAEQDYVSAPQGSLRAKLQEQRQGESSYGTIAERFAENPVEMLALLSMPLTSPASLAKPWVRGAMPPTLFHRTGPAAAASIRQTGLRPGSWAASSDSLLSRLLTMGKLTGETVQVPSAGMQAARTFPLGLPAWRVPGQAAAPVSLQGLRSAFTSTPARAAGIGLPFSAGAYSEVSSLEDFLNALIPQIAKDTTSQVGRIANNATNGGQ